MSPQLCRYWESIPCMNNMTADTPPAFLQNVDETEGRRPRIALMGEFSAGKSTLANLMIGSEPLQVQIVATQMPPVWVSFGTGEAVVVGTDGEETPYDMTGNGTVDPEKTAYIRVFAEEDILRLVDIVDMPGISDPNMSSEVWERVLPLADGVIWCSASTQAWRQSEAAVWETVPQQVRSKSILLLTRADMLASSRDKSRVFKRVLSETEGLFAQRQMISLLEARDAGECAEKWAGSGAEDFVNAFLDIVAELRLVLNSGDAGLSLPETRGREEVTVAGHETSSSQDSSEYISQRRPTAKRLNPVDETVGHVVEDDQDFMPKFS